MADLRSLVVGLTALGLAVTAPVRVAAQDARALVERSLAAVGGPRLESLRAIRLESIGTLNALEQSERPEGPWIRTFEEANVLRDLARERVRTSTRRRSTPWSPEWSPEFTIVADTGAVLFTRGGRSGPGRAFNRDEAIRDLRLSPERILLTARAAQDLTRLPDTTLAGVRNYRVRFSYDGRRVELVLDAVTAVPAGFIMRGLGGGFDWMWGDATLAQWFSLWGLEPPGIRYPRILVEEFNGQPRRELVYTSIVFDPPAPADSFAIPDPMRAAFAQAAATAPTNPAAGFHLGKGFRNEDLPPIEPAPGITIFPGSWYTALVRQGDGLIVLEAPISSDYSGQVLAEAAKRYPGVAIRGAVTTSDAWPHLAGVREYVARAIPLYYLDLNKPILSRLLAAPFRTAPDSLARAPRAPIWREVSGPVTVGTGPNRFQLLPVRGEGGERMMMAYFPEHRLLYASDLIQQQPDGTFFWPEYAAEVVEAVERYGVTVETVYAMHTDPLPWTTITAAVRAAWGEGGTGR